MMEKINAIICLLVLIVSISALDAQVLEDDTLIIGDSPVKWVGLGDTCTLTVYMKNSIEYEGWQIPVEFYPYTADSSVLHTSLTLDSIMTANSVMMTTPIPWMFRSFFDNNYEWDNAIQCGAAGAIHFFEPIYLSPGAWTVFEIAFNISENAIPQTVIIDTTNASWVSGGPKNDFIVTAYSTTRYPMVRSCTLSIGGHLWNDTLIIGDVVGYPGQQVAVPIYMKNVATPISAWNMPITFGNGSAPLVCDSIHYMTGEWNVSLATVLNIDNTGQNICYGGFTITPNPAGYHKVMELFITIDGAATAQTVVIDTTTYSSFGRYSVNSTRITNVRSGSIQIRNLLAGDSLKIKDRSIHPGQHISMPIDIKTSVDVMAWEIPLSFGTGTAGIYLDSISFIDAWAGYAIIDNINQKCLVEGVAEPANPAGEHRVATLWFTGLFQGTYWVDTTTYDFGTDAIKRYGINSSGNWYMTRVKPGYLQVLVGIEEQIQQNAGMNNGVYPTVVRSGSDINIRYSMPKSGDIMISLYDAAGRKINTIYRGNSEAGSTELPFNTRNLPNGVYFVCIKYEDESLMNKIIITR